MKTENFSKRSNLPHHKVEEQDDLKLEKIPNKSANCFSSETSADPPLTRQQKALPESPAFETLLNFKIRKKFSSLK